MLKKMTLAKTQQIRLGLSILYKNLGSILHPSVAEETKDEYLDCLEDAIQELNHLQKYLDCLEDAIQELNHLQKEHLKQVGG